MTATSAVEWVSHKVEIALKPLAKVSLSVFNKRWNKTKHTLLVRHANIVTMGLIAIEVNVEIVPGKCTLVWVFSLVCLLWQDEDRLNGIETYYLCGIINCDCMRYTCLIIWWGCTIVFHVMIAQRVNLCLLKLGCCVWIY